MEQSNYNPHKSPVKVVLESPDQPGIPLYFQFDDNKPVWFATVPIQEEMHLITLDTKELARMHQDPVDPIFCYIINFFREDEKDNSNIHTFKIFHVYNGINEHLLKQPELTKLTEPV